MGLLDSGGMPSLQEIMADQRRQQVFSGLTTAGMALMGGAPPAQGLMAGLGQIRPTSSLDTLKTYATYQQLQDAELEREQEERQREAQEAYLSGTPQLAGPTPLTGGLTETPTKGLMTGVSPEERALAVAVGPDAYFAAKAKQHFAAPKDPLLRDFKEGHKYVTKRFNRTTREWEPTGSTAPRYKPETNIQVGSELPDPPTGYFYTGIDPKNPQLAPIPGWTGPDATKRKEALNTVGRMEDGLERYTEVLRKHGAEVLPGKAKMELKAAYTNLLMEGKELFNLGVLNGPDLEIMQQYLQDPTTLKAKGYEAIGGLDPFIAQLDQVWAKLDAAKARAEGLYGTPSGPAQTAEPGRFGSMTPEELTTIDVKNLSLEELRQLKSALETTR